MAVVGKHPNIVTDGIRPTVKMKGWIAPGPRNIDIRTGLGKTNVISFDASEIVDWAGRPDAQHQLPELLRRLVLATTESLTKVRFPSGSSVTTPGFDGEVGTSSGNPWVPIGSSYWEVSTNGRPREKAESDYENRSTGDDAGIDPEGTYVAVTARRWGDRRQWEQQNGMTAFGLMSASWMPMTW